MTLLEIKTAIASYFGVTLSDLTINSQDLCLLALNQARRQAENLHDFEFSRRLVTVSVNGVTGGSLASAEDYVTDDPVDVKSVIEVGLFDAENNFTPVEWTTVAEGLERQRCDNNYTTPRYPTDGWYATGPQGMGRFQFAGDNIFRWPKDQENNFTLGLEVYAFQEDWDANDLSAATVTVSGTLVPDVTGTFNPIGSANGSTFYIHTSNNYYLRYSFSWQIGTFATGEASNNWLENGVGDLQDPTGTYDPDNGASGTATVVLNAASSTTDLWIRYGHVYLMWAAIVILNHRFKEFVWRTEGNVAPPEKQRDEALQAFIEWDAARYETNRRHGRV